MPIGFHAVQHYTNVELLYIPGIIGFAHSVHNVKLAFHARFPYTFMFRTLTDTAHQDNISACLNPQTQRTWLSEH